MILLSHIVTILDSVMYLLLFGIITPQGQQLLKKCMLKGKQKTRIITKEDNQRTQDLSEIGVLCEALYDEIGAEQLKKQLSDQLLEEE